MNLTPAMLAVLDAADALRQELGLDDHHIAARWVSASDAVRYAESVNRPLSLSRICKLARRKRPPFLSRESRRPGVRLEVELSTFITHLADEAFAVFAANERDFDDRVTSRQVAATPPRPLCF